MKIANIKTSPALAIMMMLAGCSSSQQPSALKSELPGNIPDRPVLGQAYDSKRAHIFNLTCVSGTEVQVRNSSSDLEYTKDMSFQKILSQINGDLSVGINFPAVSAEAGVGYASENAATDLSETHTLSLRATPKSIKLDVGSLKMSSTGADIVRNDGAHLEQRCGNEFISQMDLGASFIATLKFEFANKEDKDSLSGKLKVDVNLGMGGVNVQGNLSDVDNDLKRRVKVSLKATQEGGLPQHLFSVLDPSVAFCDLTNIQNCISQFSSILAYARTDLRTQLDDINNYNVIKFQTARYAESGGDVPKLVPATPTPQVTQEITDKRQRLEKWYEREKVANHRAETVLNNYIQYLNSDQEAKVKAIRDATNDNAREIVKVIQICFDQPNQACLNADPRLTSYNVNDLTVSIPKSNDASAICARERQWLMSNNRIDTNEFELHSALNEGPVYVSPNDRNSSIGAWAECSVVAADLKRLQGHN